MDAGEAREHLEMVDRILAKAQAPRPLRPWPRFLVAIGSAAALMDGGAQLDVAGHGSAVAIAGAALLVTCWVYMVWVSISIARHAQRMSLAQARMGSAIRAVWSAIVVAAFAQPHVFAEWASAAIWSLGAAIQMLVVGFAGDRRAVFAGCVLLASILAANYVRGFEGYVLAAGFMLGYVVPGILYMLDRDDSAACG